MTRPSSIRRAGSLAAIVAALALAIGPAPLAQQTQTPAKTPQTPAKKNPLLKLVEPWPEDEVLLARRTEAETRSLFGEAQPLAFTLTADFAAINKDRNPQSTRRFPATLSVSGGASTSLPVRLGTRGHFRLMARNCGFVPLRVEFPRDRLAGTPFDGQSALKLGTHCQNEREYEQYTLREYLTYTLFNMVTPRSFRARLAQATYVDQKSSKPLTTRYALFIEHENDVARRLAGRVVELERLEFKDLDRDALTTMMLFEYMIGNTDFSIWALHNVRIVQDKKKTLVPVPYDFDISGLVAPPYAVPDARLRLANVGERFYRGPCRTVEEFDSAAGLFRERRAQMVAAIDGQPDLAPASRGHMKAYLEGFFRAIERPASIKRYFVDGCRPQPAM
jgi:hypothetical protein